MTARALRIIEAELIALAAASDQHQPIDPHAVRLLAVKVGAQAEMVEKELAE